MRKKRKERGEEEKGNKDRKGYQSWDNERGPSLLG